MKAEAVITCVEQKDEERMLLLLLLHLEVRENYLGKVLSRKWLLGRRRYRN